MWVGDERESDRERDTHIVTDRSREGERERERVYTHCQLVTPDSRFLVTHRFNIQDSSL